MSTMSVQQLRGTRKPRQPRRIPGSGAWVLGAHTRSEPEAPAYLGSHPRLGCALASPTARAPSLSRATLRRQSSEIRAVCANERPSRAVRGVPSNQYPYRDPATGGKGLLLASLVGRRTEKLKAGRLVLDRLPSKCVAAAFHAAVGANRDSAIRAFSNGGLAAGHSSALSPEECSIWQEVFI